MSRLTQSLSWQKLSQLQASEQPFDLRGAFKQDERRAERMTHSACGLRVDLSKNYLNDTILEALQALLQEADWSEWQQRMFSGAAINHTENRAVLHTALRAEQGLAESKIHAEVSSVLARMRTFVEAVHEGRHVGYTGKPITDIVNIGIGGSDLGPKMVTHALRAMAAPNRRVHYVSNVDATDIQHTLAQLNPETTLFLVASKTFTTLETMLNANSAKAWFLEQTQSQGDTTKHFVALSSNVVAAEAFGVAAENVFEFWDWVGGRYSLWSAIGLSIALYLGMDQFDALRRGAAEMDQHFLSASPEENLPVLLALTGIWYSNFLGASTQAILPYDVALEYFPAFLQQLDMESNGKSVDREGQPVDYTTGSVVWGGLGINAQHAFYQLIHQGTHLIPCDFIISERAQAPVAVHAESLKASCVGQSEALLQGRSEKALQQLGESPDLIPHKVFLGNKPSTTITLDEISPETLGALIAMYEHKVFVQSVVWRINAFDQWGVELGKQLTKKILVDFSQEASTQGHDASTNALIDRLKRQR